MVIRWPRRHGKTAILHAANQAAERQQAIILFLDAESYAGLDDLVRALVAEAARLLRSDAARAGDRILAFFSRLNPIIAYNPGSSEWSVSIHAEAREDQTPLFIEALEGVARLEKHVQKPVAVVIDEFQKVIEWGGEHAEGQIRAALQRHTDEDVPYNVQALASVAWDLLRDRPSPALTRATVQQALQPLVSRDRAFYVTLWNGLTLAQQKVLRAAIREKGVALSSMAVARRHGVASSTVSKALRALEERQILRREEEERSVRWRLEDPFFGAWLK
ncbi:MAG TPA: hypothetical protein VMB48_10700 [Steroidobacteraceae bacterium]|nr:hypothetical protein [Steroidobacteraceae bacterium]